MVTEKGSMTPEKPRWLHSIALQVAREIVSALEPFTTRIEIAGVPYQEPEDQA